MVWDSRGWQDQLAQEAAEAGIRPTDEVGRDRWMYDRAWRNIRTDPHGFARSCVVRLLRFWSLIPLTDSPAPGVTLAVGLLHALIFIGLAASLFRSRRPAALQLVWTLAWAMLIAFSTVHLLYWSNARMRAPLVAAIALLSALGWAGSRTHTRTESTE